MNTETLEHNELAEQQERDELILAQMQERQALQKRFDNLRAKHNEDRRILARSIGQALRMYRQQSEKNHDRTRTHRRSNGPDLLP